MCVTATILRNVPGGMRAKIGIAIPQDVLQSGRDCVSKRTPSYDQQIILCDRIKVLSLTSNGYKGRHHSGGVFTLQARVDG